MPSLVIKLITITESMINEGKYSQVLSVRLGVEVLKKSSTFINLNITKVLPAATVTFSKWNLDVTVDCVVDRTPNSSLIWSFLQHLRCWEDLLLIRYNKLIHPNKKELNSIRCINRYKKTTSWKQCQICRCYQYLLLHSGNVKGRSYNGTSEFTFLGPLTELYRNQDSGFQNHVKKICFLFICRLLLLFCRGTFSCFCNHEEYNYFP